MSAARVSTDGVVTQEDGSQLALVTHTLAPEEQLELTDDAADTLLFVHAGDGTLTIDGTPHPLTGGAAALALTGESATVAAGANGLGLLRVSVGPWVDRHAALGEREAVVHLDAVDERSATGKRSFQILFGPHNGSTRATLFAGFIPSGRAPWHYHLYDEIVWVPEGPARLHLEGGAEEVGPGAAFRLHAREVHIVENIGEREMAVIGVFTPAGSPSAAYLPPDVDSTYAITDA